MRTRVALGLAALLTLAACSNGTDDGQAGDGSGSPLPDGAPRVFEALHCKTISSQGGVWRCKRGAATAIFYPSTTPQTAYKKVLALPKYNENSAGLFQVEDGVLYVPGSPFLDEMYALAQPDDPRDAQVVDTDLF